MNLETSSKTPETVKLTEEISLDDFDFKPITSGLGFHQPKPVETKPSFIEKPITTQLSLTPPPSAPLKKDMQVYQNDLSLFYGKKEQAVEEVAFTPELPAPKIAGNPIRFAAYVLDLLLLSSVLSLVLIFMARMAKMDLLEIWEAHPQEITPLAVTLFCGFYLIYFSIFEKASQSTLGKSLFNLKVVKTSGETPSLLTLLARASITLLNILSLGFFSYFDLQGKVTDTKIIREL